MKTKDLIEMLQDADPSGEMDCVVNNPDVLPYNLISFIVAISSLG